MLMVKFCQFLTELPARDSSVFLFRTVTSVNLNGFSWNLGHQTVILEDNYLEKEEVNLKSK